MSKKQKRKIAKISKAKYYGYPSKTQTEVISVVYYELCRRLTNGYKCRSFVDALKFMTDAGYEIPRNVDYSLPEEQVAIAGSIFIYGNPELPQEVKDKRKYV